MVPEKQALSEFEGLVFTARITEPAYTTADIIAKYAGVDIQSINRLTRNHKDRLEKFGKVGFEIRPSKEFELTDLKSINRVGRKYKIWHYNEQQATVLMTYLKNTPKVLNFKDALVKAFFDYRDQAKQWQEARQDNRLTNKDLAVVIKERYPDNPHLYQNLHRLAWVQAIGITPAKFKALHGVKDPYSDLTPKQEQTLENVKEAIKALVKLDMDYTAIKKTLEKVGN